MVKSYREIPWIEKYRPKKLSDVIYQTQAISIMEQIVQVHNYIPKRTGLDILSCMTMVFAYTGVCRQVDESMRLVFLYMEEMMPHMIFCGPPGTGKTSAALAMARQIYGIDGMRERVLELNASDERGIDVVRDRIKNYTRINISNNKINPETNRVMPNYKIIILDEADMITADAQSALRRVIECYSNISRFILICNYIHKIIGPIYSRCSVFHFRPIDQSSQISRLESICGSEHVKYDYTALRLLTRISLGDMRKSITLLQSAVSLYNEVTEDTVHSVSGQPPRSIVENIIRSCRDKHSDIEKVCLDIIYDGWDVAILFQQLVEYVIIDDTINDINKSKITLEISNRDYALLQGGSQYFQLTSACYHIKDTIIDT